MKNPAPGPDPTSTYRYHRHPRHPRQCPRRSGPKASAATHGAATEVDLAAHDVTGLDPIFLGSLEVTLYLPDTHALRCNGVPPIDGLIVARSPERDTVITVPSPSFLTCFCAGRTTFTSADAAGANSTDDTATTEPATAAATAAL